MRVDTLVVDICPEVGARKPVPTDPRRSIASVNPRLMASFPIPTLPMKLRDKRRLVVPAENCTISNSGLFFGMLRLARTASRTAIC